MMDRTARTRTARLSGAPALAGLCEELGHASTPAQVRDRLCLLEDPERTLLVADDDQRAYEYPP